MTKPFRLTEGGSRIDRNKRVTFSFDGRDVTGFAGDTVASAVLAAGQKLFGLSFKYHRPRGVVGLGSEEMNALIGVGADARHEPNLRATQVEVFQGLVSVSQNRWPSLRYDLGAANSLLSRFLPAGFYYKTFKWPQAFWKHVYEPLIRRTAGLGKAAIGPDPDLYEHMHVHVDVLVIGGGLAGLVSAETAALAGAKVLLCDENSELGGIADLTAGMINGACVADWLAPLMAQLADMPNVQLLKRTTVVGHFHHNYLMAHERVADHDPALLAAGAPRQRVWKIRTKHVILATGALERPLAFANNDRPNIMLASAARGLLSRYAVVPGMNGVVFTNNDDAYLTAFALKKAGVNVQVVDSRARPGGDLVNRAQAEGIVVSLSSVISAVEGTSSVSAVKIASYRKGQGRVITERKVLCDFIAMSGGWNPVLHLWAHNGGKIKFDEALQSFRPDTHRDAITAVGAANGTMSVKDTVAEAQAAAEAAAKAVLKKAKPVKSAKLEVKEPKRGALEALWFAPATGQANEGGKHFIDFQNDVTVADLELAQREGYESVEHTKRYTTFGMATDQGKTSNLNGLGLLADATGNTIPEIGTTTFRPPYTPYSFGAIAGALTKELFLPVRRTSVFDWHIEKGAIWEPVGQWRRAYTYPKAGEDKTQSIAREVLAVRNNVGLLDASTLGKIEIKGPDAAAFLDRVYTNTFSTLKVGKCRYGLMLNELGFVMDDGVTARLADDHFVMHTTSGGADRIAAWLEEWLQTEWTDYKVFITPVTEQWAQFALAGPKAREVLAKLEPDFDLDTEAFPHMSFKLGKLGGFPVRVYRISFSGELSYEIATPSGLGLSLWKALIDAGADCDIAPYGTEALHILRAEKGYIVVGDETDGTTTADDVGLGGMVSKKKADFIGKRSLGQTELTRRGRKQLVGLLTEEPNEVLPDGAYAVAAAHDKPPMKTIGHVTSSYLSPTLGRSIAMVLIENGRARMGESISFSLEGGKVVKAQIVDHVFYDKDGGRIHA